MSASLDRAPFEIGVLISGWHSGIVLPTRALGRLRPLLQAEGRPKILIFGWGNQRFYMAAHPGAGDAIAALFPSPSVLFVRAAPSPTNSLTQQARIHWICVDREELWRTVNYIDDTLLLFGGSPVNLGNGPLPGSRFYASADHYSALNTCNTWTVGALQYAGLPVHAGGVIFASQVSRRVAGLRACPEPKDH